jgi:hypothetical protein
MTAMADSFGELEATSLFLPPLQAGKSGAEDAAPGLAGWQQV